MRIVIGEDEALLRAGLSHVLERGGFDVVAAASDADEFSQILKTGLDRMGCALAALWVPDKNISVSMTRSGAVGSSCDSAASSSRSISVGPSYHGIRLPRSTTIAP